MTERRLPTYLAGAPLRDAVQVYRWTPIERLTTPEPVVTERTVSGWQRDGHARVPDSTRSADRLSPLRHRE